MKRFLLIFVSACLGSLTTLAGLFYLAPQLLPATTVKQIIKTVPVQTANKKYTLTGEQIYAQFGDAVVHVKAQIQEESDSFFGFPIPENRVASGSGFFISSDGYIVTNAHVVANANDIQVKLADGTVKKAELIGLDASSDVALLKTDPQRAKFSVLSLGDSSKLKVGETVYAIGNPLGFDRSMSQGIVSALNRTIEAPNGFPIKGVIQTDAAVNRGNSGGPLLSQNGSVVGITSQIASTGFDSGNIGIAFAVPSNTVKKVVKQLKTKGKVSHAWLGIEGTDLSPELAKFLKLPVSRGVMVITILADGPAQKAGLRGADTQIEFQGDIIKVGGDIITALNNKTVVSMEELVQTLADYQSGDEVTLTIIRNRQMQKVKVKLGERPSSVDVIQ